MINDKSNNEVLTKSLRNLLKIARHLRNGRMDKGALTLGSMELRFTLDNDRPTGVSEYKHVDTHFMVEEFMLLANCAVAEKTIAHFPSFAILRRHPPAKQKEIDDFVELMGSFGYNIAIDSSKAFADSLDLATKPNDLQFNKLVRIMATRCMH